MPARDPDLHYRPMSDGYRWACDLGATSCLVLGTIDDGVAATVSELFDECRAVATSAFLRRLHSGLYAIEETDGWHCILVGGGKDPAEPRSASSRGEEESHLVDAKYLRIDLWAAAEPLASGAQFVVGDLVRVTGSGKLGRIKSHRRVDPHVKYEVMVDGVVEGILEGNLDRVLGDPEDPQFWLDQVPGTAEQLALTLTWTKLTHSLTDTLYSYASSKTIFRPYQFKPVLKLLNSSVGRMLIADEVGLGKTIEAGLIWNELDQREPVRRALVVAPSNLTVKWQSEMERRFDRKLPLLKPADLSAFAHDLSTGGDPEITGIISLESLRVAGTVLDELTEVHPRFDLVVIDEAHNLRNRGTRNFALGRLLSDWADSLIFLSATPINLGSDDLYNLVNLLDEEHFLDRAIFEAQIRPNQILNSIAQGLTESAGRNPRTHLRALTTVGESEFGASVTDRPDFLRLRFLLDTDGALDAAALSEVRRCLSELNTLSAVVTRTRKADVPDARAVRVVRKIEVEWTDTERRFYELVQAHHIARALRTNGPAFAMQMALRQAASCIPAMKERLAEQRVTVLDDEVDDVDDDTNAGTDEPVAALDLPTAELEVDTKFEMLRAELSRARESGLRLFMIFSFFRKTLSYLARRLGSDFSVGMMHGGVPMADRQKIMEDFRGGRYEILLLSEVGSEGLDFEFCNVLVNYDLPWNPMRVEQRIGRLDRFGQTHDKIFIYNMHVPGTIETDILERLYDRIRIFEGSIGELEPILREKLTDINRAMLDTRLTETERQREMDRVAVAIENNSRDLDDIERSRALLSGVDNLIVAGLGESGPQGGKFIGATELRAVLEELFRRVGGRIGKPRPDGMAPLTGSLELANELRRAHLPVGGSRYSPTHLARLLQDKKQIAVTFDPEVASRGDGELLSSRHPLVRLALKLFGAEDLALKRFGSIAVPGLPVDRTYLVRFDLTQSSGLRPRLEIWTTAVDSSTGAVARDIGDQVFDALAHGTLRTSEPPQRLDLGSLWRQLDDDVVRRQHDEEQRRRSENLALTEARIQAQQSSHEIKIRRALETIANLERDDKGVGVVKMHRGRVRALQQLQQDVAERLGVKRDLVLSVRPVAAAVATGC